MKTHWCEDEFAYDGTQLRSLFAYLEYGHLGDSIVSWAGPCEISFDHMVDGEDLRDQSPIRGSKMLHFIVECFDTQLFGGVALFFYLGGWGGWGNAERGNGNLKAESRDARGFSKVELSLPIDATIKQALEINDRPVIIDFVVSPNSMVWPMVPAGVSNDLIQIARNMTPDWEEED